MTGLPAALAERIAAAAVAEGLADAVFETVRTPIGRLLVVQSDAGVCRVAFEEESDDQVLAGVAGTMGARVLRSRAETEQVLDALEAYLEGDRDDLSDIPVDLRLVGGDFRRAALLTLHAQVPRGKTISYGELARRAGRPKAVRATGSACATNPVPIIVPCHRVLPSTGTLGSYAGGPERKARLLALEEALPED